jgi:hypothetical protein
MPFSPSPRVSPGHQIAVNPRFDAVSQAMSAFSFVSDTFAHIANG